MRACTDLRLDVLQPSIEELSDSEPIRFYGCAGLHLRNEARALDLSLPLRSRKRTPAAFALAAHVHVDDNRPTARTSLANMPSHFRSLSSKSRLIFQSSVSNS